MTLTTLDANTALIVVDLQQGIVAYPTVPPIGEVVQRTRAHPGGATARRG